MWLSCIFYYNGTRSWIMGFQFQSFAYWFLRLLCRPSTCILYGFLDINRGTLALAYGYKVNSYRPMIRMPFKRKNWGLFLMTPAEMWSSESECLAGNYREPQLVRMWSSFCSWYTCIRIGMTKSINITVMICFQNCHISIFLYQHILPLTQSWIRFIV